MVAFAVRKYTIIIQVEKSVATRYVIGRRKVAYRNAQLSFKLHFRVLPDVKSLVEEK